MNKQAVLYKLATLRLAINYVLKSRMVKQADAPSYYQGAKNLFQNTVAENMLSPERLNSFSTQHTAPSVGSEIINPWENKKIWNASRNVRTSSSGTPTDAYWYSFTSANVPEWGNQIKAEQDRLHRLYNDIPETVRPSYYDDFIKRQAGLSALKYRLKSHNNTYNGYNLNNGYPNTNPTTKEDWDKNWNYLDTERKRIASLRDLVAPEIRDTAFVDDESNYQSKLDSYNKGYGSWRLNNGYQYSGLETN